jgi:hypothetical protein
MRWRQRKARIFAFRFAVGAMLVAPLFSAQAQDAASADCMDKLQKVNALIQEEKGDALSEQAALQVLNAERRREIEAEYGRAINKAYEAYNATEADVQWLKDWMKLKGPEISVVDKSLLEERIKKNTERMNAEFLTQSREAKSNYDARISALNGGAQQRGNWERDVLPGITKRRQVAQEEYFDCLRRQEEARHEQPTKKEDIDAFIKLFDLAEEQLLAVPEGQPLNEEEKRAYVLRGLLMAASESVENEPIIKKEKLREKSQSEKKKKSIKAVRSHETIHEEQGPRHETSASALETAAGIAIGIQLRDLQRRKSGGDHPGSTRSTTGSGTCPGGGCR